MRLKFTFFLIFLYLGCTFAYKPVYLVHGLTGSDRDFSYLENVIQQRHPGTIVHATPLFSLKDSIVQLDKQVKEIGASFMNFSKSYPEGVHLIGHSQGALIARAILQYYPNHNVQNLISIAGPQAGNYGSEVLKEIGMYLRNDCFHGVAYCEVGQRILSVANFWRDPHFSADYFKEVEFLPKINNEVPHSKIGDYKRGFVKLNRFVLLGGRDDGVIQPWESTQFGFYDENEKIVPMKEQRFYKEDLFGLRTLDERGSLISHSTPGIGHIDWIANTTIIDQYIIPYLD